MITILSDVAHLCIHVSIPKLKIELSKARFDFADGTVGLEARRCGRSQYFYF
jgi:hypothetical protein